MTDAIAFVTHLESLAQKEDRGALAALRRGLGQPPGTVVAMYPHVVPWLPAELHPWQEATCYLVAALFALHPASGGAGNLGASFRLAEARDGGGNSPDERVSATERRFTALLAAHPDDLPDRLRQAVSFLASKDVPVDWHQLYRDVAQWTNPSRYVQKAWASEFWQRIRPDNEEQHKEN